ncbi:MAG: hypothetical protein JXB14_07070 [Candidatus Altiarchaeota archaeon]|nr:hypothetical protein [Candidatus Altiarchaeota archaeon]
MANTNKFLYLDYNGFAAVNRSLRVFVYFQLAFFVPFFIGQPQLLVGTIVNAMLVISALELDTKRTIPVIFAPSLAVLARGLIFGPFTPFLALMVPFIWASNALLVIIVKSLKNRRDYWISLGLAVVAKSGFLFLSALALISLSVLPVLFLTTMGELQLVTAILGGVVAFSAIKSGATKKLDLI